MRIRRNYDRKNKECVCCGKKKPAADFSVNDICLYCKGKPTKEFEKLDALYYSNPTVKKNISIIGEDRTCLEDKFLHFLSIGVSRKHLNKAFSGFDIDTKPFNIE